MALCTQHQVGTLLLRKALEPDTAPIDAVHIMQNRVILINWSCYSLTEKIKYKALKAGIELIIE